MSPESTQDEVMHSRLLNALCSDVGLAIQKHSLLLHFSQNWSVLGKTCPEIWDLVCNSLFDSMIATICRVCDSDGQGKKERLTITRVADIFDNTGQLRKRVKLKLQRCDRQVEYLKNIRHNLIGHNNLNARLGIKKFEYDPGDIQTVLDHLSECVDILREYDGWETGGWSYFSEFRLPALTETIEAGQRVVGVVD